MTNRYLLLFLFSASLLIGGCMPSPYYQHAEVIPGNAWAYDYKPDFKFDITDTTANYRIYFIIRHTEAYPFSNIWLWMDVKQPGDSTFQRSRVNITLAEPGGKWLGRGMGEIWEQRMLVSYTGGSLFTRKGTYEMRLEQNMRMNPLPEILHAGLRIEKAGNRNFSVQQH